MTMILHHSCDLERLTQLSLIPNREAIEREADPIV
jgi:hypothetical protein